MSNPKMNLILESLNQKIPKDIKISIKNTRVGTHHHVEDFFNPDYAEDIISGLEDGKDLQSLIAGNLKYKKTDKIEKGAGDKRFVLIDKDGNRYSVEIKFV